MATTDTKPRMNFLDRAIAFIAPQRAYVRMQARAALTQFGYNDHAHRRGIPPALSRSSGETYEKQRDRLKMMADARDCATFTWVGGVVGRIVTYVVGELSAKSNTGDPEVDAAYDAYFHAWAGDNQDDDGFYPCDATGRHRLIKLVQLALGAMVVDGDHGFQWIPGDEAKPPALLSIDADRIGSPMDAIQSENYVGGIGIDLEDNGKVAYYRVFQRSRMGQYTNSQDIPPSNFFHVWDPERGDEYRGRTWMLRLLNPARDMFETEEAESLAIKTQSQWAAFLTSKSPFKDNGTAEWEGKTTSGTPTQPAKWGSILRLDEGENITPFQPSQRPTGSFLAFEQLRIRQMAISLKFSYGFMWDLGTLGGATARVELKGDARRIASIRRNLVDRLLRRVRRMVLSHGVAYDGLPAHPRMSDCKWHFGQDIIVDAGYEVQNDIALTTYGAMAIDDLATKYNDGDNIDSVMERNAATAVRAQGIAAQNVIPIELFANGMFPNATAQLAAINTPPEEATPPPPPPGTLGALGDKAAKNVTDMLVAVHNGTMDRESAINTLITVYEMMPEQAQAIVPEQGDKQPKEPKGEAS